MLFFNIVSLYFNTLFNRYINLTIDGTICPSQHFPLGTAFVCQAGNIWTVLRTSPFYEHTYFLFLFEPTANYGNIYFYCVSFKFKAHNMRQMFLVIAIRRIRKHKSKFVSFLHSFTKVSIQRNEFRCYFNTVARVKENHSRYQI